MLRALIQPARDRHGQAPGWSEETHMKQSIRLFSCWLVLGASMAPGTGILRAGEPASAAPTATPRIPRFSIEYMDKSVAPGVDFYRYADGNWVKNNPVPADKSRWGAFIELQERNWFLIH